MAKSVNQSGTPSFTLIGHLVGGSTITQTFSTSSTWTEFTLDSLWQGLTQVDFVCTYQVGCIDNIVLSV